MEQYQAGGRRLGGRNTKDEERARRTDVIMGSGTIVSQLTAEGLIDEYQIVVNPIVLAKGRTMFQGIKRKLNLKGTKTRTFGNGERLTVLRADNVRSALSLI